MGESVLSNEVHNLECKVCSSKAIITDLTSGEIICSKCGAVIAERVEISQKTRAFNKEEFEERTQAGAPSTLLRHDMGLSTTIAKSDKDAAGVAIVQDTKEMMDRLRTWDIRTQSATPRSRNLVVALNYLDNIKHKLNLSDAVAEKAAYIYRKAQALKLARGRTTISLVAASVYIACREFSIQRSMKDIASVANITLKAISRAYRLLLTELDLKIPLQNPSLAVMKIASNLNVSEKTKREAMNVLAEIKERGGTAGKDPMGLAGAVLYLVSIKNNEYIVQKKLADAAGVTEVTIRNRAKELKNTYKDLF